jgi:hypothetical protein
MSGEPRRKHTKVTNPFPLKNHRFSDLRTETGLLSTKTVWRLIDGFGIQAFTSGIGTHRDAFFTGHINGNRSTGMQRWRMP